MNTAAPSETMHLHSGNGSNAREIEEALVGCVIREPQALAKIPEIEPKHFQNSNLRTVFATMQSISSVGDVISLLTVSERLQELGDLPKIGGNTELSRLSSRPESSTNIEYYAKKVIKSYTDRRFDESLMLAIESRRLGTGSEQVAGQLTEQLRSLCAEKRDRRFKRLGSLNIEPPNYLINEMLGLNTTASVFARSGDGKTFFALRILASVVSGSDFFGHQVDAPGVGVLVCAEGAQGVFRRFKAVGTHMQVDLENKPLYLTSQSIPFGDPGALISVFGELDAIQAVEGDIRLIVIDTLSQNMAGDENSSQDMPAFVRSITALKERYGACVLVLHHTGHSNTERARGHSAFRAALDWEYRLEKDIDDVIRVECTKSRDTEPPHPMAFELRTVELDLRDRRGLPVTSCVLIQIDYSAPKNLLMGLGKKQQLALDILRAEIDQHVANVVNSGRDPSEARVSVDTWKTTCKAQGIDRKRFSEIMLSLQKKKIIEVKNEYVSVR